jgi:hypothetical protein
MTMKDKKITRHLIGLLVAFCASSAHAGLLGSTATITGYFPDLSSTFFGPSVTTVTSGVEVPSSLISSQSGSIDITDTQIIWQAESTTAYGSGAFNGFGVLFSDAPAITSVTLDGATTLTPVEFSFTGNEVFLNLAGLPAVAGQATILNINASPVPLPAALWLLGSALGGLGVMRRRAT